MLASLRFVFTQHIFSRHVFTRSASSVQNAMDFHGFRALIPGVQRGASLRLRGRKDRKDDGTGVGVVGVWFSPSSNELLKGHSPVSSLPPTLPHPLKNQKKKKKQGGKKGDKNGVRKHRRSQFQVERQDLQFRLNGNKKT